MKFNTQYEREVPMYETGDDTLIVERAGYIPPKKQVENMIFSGQRLAQYRKEEFDGESDEEALENYDPTRDGDFDLADYSGIMRDLEGKAGAERSGAPSDPEGTAESVQVKETGEKA